MLVSVMVVNYLTTKGTDCLTSPSVLDNMEWTPDTGKHTEPTMTSPDVW